MGFEIIRMLGPFLAALVFQINRVQPCYPSIALNGPTKVSNLNT